MWSACRYAIATPWRVGTLGLGLVCTTPWHKGKDMARRVGLAALDFFVGHIGSFVGADLSGFEPDHDLVEDVETF